MGIGRRIKEARENLNLTQKQLAEIIGVTSSSITNYENDTSHPKENILYALLNALKVDANFLFQDCVNTNDTNFNITLAEQKILNQYRYIDNHGKIAITAILKVEVDRCRTIEQEKQKKSKKKEAEEEYKEPARRFLPDGVVLLSDYREEDKCDDNMVSMPIYDLGASAGTGVLLDSNYYEVAAMPDTPMTRKANFAIWVNGHSMEPKFNDGDLVLVRTQPTVDVGEIGIFIVNGNGFIKKQGEDRLISLNPDYDDVEISEWDEVYCKGKVLGKL